MNKLFIKFAVVVILCWGLLPLPSYSATISYQYDRINRLTSVTYEDGTRITYAYDPAGNRLSRTIAAIPLKGDINGDKRVSLMDAIQGLQILSGSNPDGIRSDYAGSGADVDGDQKIGLEEVVYILQKAATLR